MYFNREKTLKLCLTAVLLAAVLALCLSPDFYSSTITSIDGTVHHRTEVQVVSRIALTPTAAPAAWPPARIRL